MSHQPGSPPDGPAADRPRPYPLYAAPHTPLRPMWCCRACGQQWPCPTARLLLRTEYEDNPVSLSIYLCGLLYEATRDLYRLNPAGAPSPTDMFTRFVAWGPYRRPPVSPGGGC